jgi:hypothetical protein
MSDFVSRRPDSSLDQWLADQHRHTVTDLAATLDLEAGLREAMIPVRHANLVADLGGILDVEAGLSAIVPTAPDLTPHEPEPNASRYATDAELPTTEGFETDPNQASPDPTSLTDLEGLVRVAASRSPSTRLVMRNCPTFNLARDIVGDIDSTLDIDRDRAGRDLAHAFNLARARAREIDRDIDRALDIDRDIDRARRDLAHAFNLARARANARDIDHALASASRDIDHALASASRDIDHDFYRVLVGVLVRARARALDIDHALVSASCDLDLDLVRDLALDLARDLDRTTRLVADFYHALNDFTGADLRSVDLAGISLDGLRWSTATQWPSQWGEQVRRDSVQIGDELFEVRAGGNRYAPIPDLY